MQSTLKIINLENNKDVRKIGEILTNLDGIIAYEINKSKKELKVFFDTRSLNEENMINNIENGGYSIL